MKKPVHYQAKYGNVWQNIDDKKMHGDTIEIKDDDNIRNYTQVRKPKTETQEHGKPNRLTRPAYQPTNGGIQ